MWYQDEMITVQWYQRSAVNSIIKMRMSSLAGYRRAHAEVMPWWECARNEKHEMNKRENQEIKMMRSQYDRSAIQALHNHFWENWYILSSNERETLESCLVTISEKGFCVYSAEWMPPRGMRRSWSKVLRRGRSVTRRNRQDVSQRRKVLQRNYIWPTRNG